MSENSHKPIRAFLTTEMAGGLALVVACAVAITLANSPIAQGYEDFFHPLHAFISEGLMSIFFFLVGLEIKREFLEGELRNPRVALLPVIAALGGMIFPALIYWAFNHQLRSSNGWAIPMPTDIALSLGALALLGSRIDTSLKIFLLTLAIADDLGSIIVLGVFYSGGISPIRIASTIGAVGLAWIIPLGKKLPISKLINLIHPWTSFLIIPIFVLANVGIVIEMSSLGSVLSSPVAKGIIIGRVVGKIVGITLFAYIAVKLRIAVLPRSLNFKEISGAAALAGMGLTVSLFIADLATNDLQMLTEVKIGLIIAAIISVLLGLVILRKYSVAQD